MHSPCRRFQSIVPSIVTHEQIGAGLALNSTQFSLSRILGPSIAGVLMSSVGAMSCFVVSAVSYLPFIGVALWIFGRRAGLRRLRCPDAHPRRHLLAGIGTLLRQPHLRGALLTVLATGVLCGPLITFTPVLVKNVFHGSAGRFSAAVVSFGVGGLIGAAGLLSVAPSVDRRRLSSYFAIVQGAALVLIAVNPWFWATLALLALAGASMGVSNTAANSLVQATAKPRQLGQTVSLYMLALRGGISVGALITGATVGLLGVQHALLLNGIAAVAVQAVVARSWFRAPVPVPGSA